MNGDVVVGQAGDDHAAIAELVYRYGMAVDSLDGDAFASCFPPGTMDDAAKQQMIEFHSQYVHTMHNIHNRVHTIDGDVATGTTYCVCTFVKEEDDGRLMKFDIHFQYDNERFERRNGRWYIVGRTMTAFFTTVPIAVVPGFLDGFWGDLPSHPAGSARSPRRP